MLAITLLVTQPVAFGQDLPVYSDDLLRDHALTNVVSGSRYVDSPDMDWAFEGRLTATNAIGKGAENVLNALFAVEMKYRLINSNAVINGNIYLHDKHGALLFYGRAEYIAASLETGKPSYNLWLQDVPLGENVQSAEVLALDADGRTARRYNMQVDSHGRVVFQSGMAGSTNGILVTRLSDGTLVTYDLSKRASTVPGVTSDGSAVWKIDGHHVVTVSPKEPKVKIAATYLRPTAYFHVPSDQVVTFDVVGIIQENGQVFFERPYQLEVTSETSGASGPVTLSVEGPSSFSVDKGTYRIHNFGWKKFGTQRTIYTGPEVGTAPAPVSGGGGSP